MRNHCCGRCSTSLRPGIAGECRACPLLPTLPIHRSRCRSSAVQRRLFLAIHSDRLRLGTVDEISAFVAKNGVEPTRFVETMNSFSVAGKTKQATQLTAGYNIEGTPSLGVDGRWLTSGSLAGSNARSLAVADYLVALAKKSG